MTGTTLHAFRDKLRHQNKAELQTWYKCTNCNSIYSKWSGRCESCGKWNTLRTSTGRTNTRSAKKKEAFVPEVERGYIVQYLKSRSATHQPVKIYYKDDATFRVFYNYTFDDKYIHTPSTEGYDFKYLIDKIRNIEL